MEQNALCEPEMKYEEKTMRHQWQKICQKIIKYE